MNKLAGLTVFGRVREEALLDLPFWIDTNRLENKKHFASCE